MSDMTRLAWRVIPVRVLLAWNCLRGWPVAYRITIEDGRLTLRGASHAKIVECVFIDTAVEA